tara:strand:- start:281 stop:667 length:387 start_codon:yes stop_codon:yes gene_type:complete
MAGISVKLPLATDKQYGVYSLNKTFKQVTKQNLKHLLLTIPGERIMDTNFGAGLIKALFEMNTPELNGSIDSRIRKQVKLYMPYIKIEDIRISNAAGSQTFESPGLSVTIRYKIASTNEADLLDISIK